MRRMSIRTRHASAGGSGTSKELSNSSLVSLSVPCSDFIATSISAVEVGERDTERGAPGTVQTHVSCRSRFALSGRVAIGRTNDETGKRRETRHIGAEVGVGSDTTDRLRGCRVRLPAHSVRLRLTKYNIANPTSFRGKCYGRSLLPAWPGQVLSEVRRRDRGLLQYLPCKNNQAIRFLTRIGMKALG